MSTTAFYPHGAIFGLSALAAALSVDETKLVRLGEQASRLYRTAGAEVKPDGTLRHVFDTRRPLKPVLQKINREFLRRVEFPTYLHGSLKGRDYKSNAEMHVGARVVVSLDIKAFFPSTTAAIVHSVWRGVFGFGNEVAALLTKITCRDGVLEQGAPTSSFLANLAFWDREPSLAERLRQRGFQYSRYVDDIAISSRDAVGRDDIAWAIAQVYGMLGSRGYSPKRSKEKIMRASRPIVLMGLVANAKVSLPQQERGRIRAAAHQAAKAIVAGTPMVDLRSTQGRVYKLRRFHPVEGQRVLQSLKVAAGMA